MCRFTLYLGPSISLNSLLIEPTHSLIRQSIHSHEREEPLNGDGFGVGWYAQGQDLDPAVFRSITPAWNNRNLHNLARVIRSHCFLAHVRAATLSSGVNEANCHPFRFHQYLCMHNGDVGNFRKVRRQLLDSVCDDAFNQVFGSTDSEVLFAVIIDELLKTPAGEDSALARALGRAIQRVVAIVREYGDDEPSYLNIALTDGIHAAVSRYANDPDGQPESLYYYCGELYHPVDANAAQGEVVVSSEKLTNAEGWIEVPPNHMVVLGLGKSPELARCGP